MSLFQIRNFTDEFLAAPANQAVSVAADETVAEVAQEVREATEDLPSSAPARFAPEPRPDTPAEPIRTIRRDSPRRPGGSPACSAGIPGID